MGTWMGVGIPGSVLLVVFVALGAGGRGGGLQAPIVGDALQVVVSIRLLREHGQSRSRV